jgi:hypothetical protein
MGFLEMPICGKINLMKRNLLRNLEGLFNFTPRDYHLDRSGFATDARNLRRDFVSVGRCLKKNLDRESSDQRARQD